MHIDRRAPSPHLFSENQSHVVFIKCKNLRSITTRDDETTDFPQVFQLRDNAELVLRVCVVHYYKRCLPNHLRQLRRTIVRKGLEN